MDVRPERFAGRFRNGSPWRDPDLIQVLLVGVIATAATLGGAYAWALARTLRTAHRSRRDPGDATSVVLFGKRLAGGRPDPEYLWRLRHALRLLRDHPHLVVLLSGGRSGGPEAPSEAEFARRWLLRRMPEAAPRLRLEERSLDTVDNLRLARAMLPPGKVALLSNRYHLARCALLARTMGLEAHCVGAEPHLRRDWPTRRRLALEAGYHTLFVIGLGWARLIRHRRMLERVS